MLPSQKKNKSIENKTNINGTKRTIDEMHVVSIAAYRQPVAMPNDKQRILP